MSDPARANARSGGLGVGPRPRIATWVHHHRQAASDSLHKLLNEPVSTLLTWLVVGIALALPSGLLVILDNVSGVIGDIEAPARFSLLLEDDVSLASAKSLAEGLQARIDIEQAEVVDRDTALASFAADTGLDALLDSLDTNPLPHTILVKPAPALGDARLSGLVNAISANSRVSETVFDTRWLSRLEATLELAMRLVIGLGTLMLVGVLLIMANTIRLAIEARRAEIVVIKLIGGGDAFARRPFLYTGLWFGIGGGMLGAVLVAALIALLMPPVTQLLSLYDSDRQLGGFGIVGVLNLILVGGALGLASAWQAAGLHLRRMEPR